MEFVDYSLVHCMQFISHYNPPINFRAHSLDERHHVVQIGLIHVVRFGIRRSIL